MTPTYKEYIIHQAKMKQSNLDAHNRNNQIINDKVIRQGTTTDNSITNMTSAYNQVRNSGYTPSPEEISYRRFSSGSFLDMEPKD